VSGFVAHLPGRASAAQLAKRRKRHARMRALAGSAAAMAGHTLRGVVVGARFLPELLGAATVSYGFWLAWHPAGFLAAGVAMLALGRRTAP
jgi:hypothetical protein